MSIHSMAIFLQNNFMILPFSYLSKQLQICKTVSQAKKE